MTEDILSKGELTRQTIEDAAIALFMEQGYHATSMRQIAERAELALGGIYNHFKSKEVIFEAVIVDKHPYKRVLPLVLEVQGDTTEEFLKNAIQVVLKEMSREPYYLKLMMIEFVEFDGGHGAAMLKEVAPKILPVFEQIVQKRKDMRVTNPVVLMRSFLGMVISYIITDMIMSNSVLSPLIPKNMTDAYVDLFLHGVLKESA